jgi:hypothetical protein
MNKKILCESLDEFRKLNENDEPLALAILGAPAGGKSFQTKNIKQFVKDNRISDTLDKGVALTIDKLRSEFQSKNPLQQLVGFVRAFYYLRKRSLEDNVEYGKWFEDISALWKDKITKLAPALKITIDKYHIYFDGAPAWKNLKALRNTGYSPEKLIKELDKYSDYKRVVRYFQNIQQTKAIKKLLNISYDESGDEPKKIINTMRQLHKKGYVTDVFLIHPENVASNLIQNYYRVVTGRDEGRDSSEAIVDAYNQIEKNKDLYSTNAEDDLQTTSKDLQKENPKISDTVEKANVEDDPRRGDKPIDVFTEVETMKPIEAYNFFNKKLNKEQQIIFRALLKYCIVGIKDLPENAKSVLSQITKSINNKQALNILKKTADSGKYAFQWGGITQKLVKKAETVLK